MTAQMIICAALVGIIVGLVWVLIKLFEAYSTDVRRLATLTEWKAETVTKLKTKDFISIEFQDDDGTTHVRHFELMEEIEEWPAEVQ